MGIKIFKKEAAAIRKVSGSYSISNFLTVADSAKISLAVGMATDHQETTKTTSDRAYFILEGEILIDDNISGQAGDCLFIPADTEYDFKGTFKAVIVNSPPFKRSNENIRELKAN